MKQTFTLLLCMMISPLFAQQTAFVKTYKHFNESRGNAENVQILTLPYEETVKLFNSLNSKSGLGPTFNYYGNVVVVDQMDRLPNGEVQLILRREDGRNFYGYRPTIKAVLSTNIPSDPPIATLN
ncbi:MAG: hypothetical protein AAF717_03965 [Bacteroidota bacterium]